MRWRVAPLRAACLLDRFAQHELDLPVEAAQIVVRPALKGLQQSGIDAKQEWFAFGHSSY